MTQIQIRGILMRGGRVENSGANTSACFCALFPIETFSLMIRTKSAFACVSNVTEATFTETRSLNSSVFLHKGREGINGWLRVFNRNILINVREFLAFSGCRLCNSARFSLMPF